MLGGRWSCRSSGSHEARNLPDVSPARGARSCRESKREKPRNFRGALLQRTRPPLCGGGPAAVPRSGSRSREAADSRPGARRATGTWGARAGLRPPCGKKRLGSRGAAVRSRLAGLGTGNRAVRPWASRARRAGAGKFLSLQPSRSGGYGAGGAHLPRPQHCFSACVHCASCNPSRAGFGAHRPRPGGADGFFAERSSSLRGAKNERRDSALDSPSGAHGTPNSKADGN